MFSKEFRPLKRPKLGVPDYYPQESKQKEDELSYQSLNSGFRSQPILPPGQEFEGALKDFNQHFLSTKEYTLRVTQVEDERRRRRWVQDSEKKKLQVSKDNFFPVPLGRNRKEIATQWFQDLASSKPLSQLAKKVPIFNKKEEIFDNLCEKDVPISRAAWYIKMSSAYNVVMTDSKLTKKKQTSDPSFDWTLSLTKYMQDIVWRICNESQVMGRHDSHSGRTPSTSSRHSPSDETLMEITHWQYMLHLSSWLYEENLLDKHEFIRWLVDRTEHVKSADTKALQLHLPLVLRHLLDIANCVSLARPLVTYCCERLATLFEMEQRLHKLHPPVKHEPTLEKVLESSEDDSVFSEPSIKQEAGRAHAPLKDIRSVKMSPSDKKDGKSTIPVIGGPSDDDHYFHWCSHHQSVMLELVAVIQTIAVRCPTAFVQIKIPGGRGILLREGDKVSSPLTILPCSLLELPMPATLKPDLQKKLLAGLAAAEAEIVQRNKAAESRWSSMTVTDLQTTSEGSNVKQILKILEVLDKSSFTSCRANNPLTMLYVRIAGVQRSSEAPLSDEMLTMLLCTWATTRHRYGDHRPLVAARILWQRQNDVIKGEGWSESYNKDKLDDSWEECGLGERLSENPYPLQSMLLKYLDTRAPLPDDLSGPMQSTDPFFKLVVLFGELIRLDVFSYRHFLSTLIARGESRPPIIPSLPFARDGDSEKSRKRQDSEPLNLSIPLPALKKLRYDQSEVSIASGPSSPVSSSSFSGIGLTTALDSLITSSPPQFQPDDESAAIMEDRAKKLRMLEHESSSQLMSPLHFNTLATDTDAPNSPIANFSLSLLAEDEHILDTPLNKQASRHLLYAVYFPVADSQLSQQSLNERSVVLCGVGRSRQRVEALVQKITDDINLYYRRLDDIQTPVLPEEEHLQSIMTSYQSLPMFEQSLIAISCEQRLRQSFSPLGKVYPSCAQLVFVCELLKVCGAMSQLLQLLVDVVSGSAFSGEDEGRRFKDPQHPSVVTLPTELRVPVIALLNRYSSCLLLSQQDTAVVFEGLFRVLNLPMTSSTQKSVLLFLHKLYSDCSYLQSTFRPFGNYCLQFGEKFGLSTDWYKPTATDGELQKTVISQMLSNPSVCDVSKLYAVLKSGGYFNINFCFALEVFSQVVSQRSVNCELLSQLAFICAEMCFQIDKGINCELMGVFRALCIPNQSSTKTGFTALTNKTNIVIDPGIHSSLLVFVCFLIAYNVFRLQDVIVYIFLAVTYVQLSSLSHHGYRSLEFVTSLILQLLAPEHSESQTDAGSTHKLPPFVTSSLLVQCREVSLGYVILLLKNLLKISHSSGARDRTKTTSLHVQSSSTSNEAILSKVRSILETVGSQDWLRDRCSGQGSRLFETDMLGDTSLTPTQARYLLHLLCPYAPSVLPSDASTLAKTEPQAGLEHILKTLDQWTLGNALLHINVHIQQAGNTRNTALQDHLASVVIHIFEDSCSDEFLGQTIECSVESGDGSYSPRVWLVTPLISQLPQSVLGRVLKSAGNILGQGQWWNPEKNQEKRRSTRATSGVAPPKTGLQWQQPFLELVLACMHAQTNTHEELLTPLKSQLSTFHSAYDREGTPTDEQSKTMLFAAIKLRLSLVGSMLGSICSNEQSTLEWVPLIMQLICSGAVDRQTDTSELFTNCLDMLCTLLHSLAPDFHTCLATAGEEGKKAYTGCVKKLKSELNSAKSYCVEEIQQLFPLSQEAYTVTTVKQPDSVSYKTSSYNYNAYTERIKGLRVQDSRDVSPWDILEGVKGNGPLLLSWFGGVRVKRKPLRFEEQRWLLQFHTHQDQFKEMMYHPCYVKLPEAVSPEVTDAPKPDIVQTPTVESSKTLGPEPKPDEPKIPLHGGSNQPMQPPPVPRAIPMPHPPMAPRPTLAPRTMIPAQIAMMRAGLHPSHGIDPRKAVLQSIQRNALKANRPQYPQHQPMYPPGQQRMLGPMGRASYNPALQGLMAMRAHHNRRQLVHTQQMQAHQHTMAMQGQFGGYQHPGMQPMQANPPVPMHQVMARQGPMYRNPMMPQQTAGNMMVPGNQQGMQYPPQHPNAMNSIHRF